MLLRSGWRQRWTVPPGSPARRLRGDHPCRERNHMPYTIDPRPIQICWTGPQQWSDYKVSERLPIELTGREPIVQGTKPRYMIHHPASWLAADVGPTHNMAQFYTLPKAVRDAYDAVILDAWKYGAHAKHFTLGITCHLLMPHPFS